MKITIEDDFDLKKIADSGQCFRFNDCGDYYLAVAGDRFVTIREAGENLYEFSCDEAEFEGFWREYFDLGTDYRAIRARINKETAEYLYNASTYGKGIRILKQDPWEMLISFIISQRKNIPAIKASIEKICALAGHEIGKAPDGSVVYSFPGPKELASVTLEQLKECSLGYRDKYVYTAAQDVAAGALKLDEWKQYDDSRLMEALLKIYGVGVKVANCEILFGYHRLDAFPKDVWINRVLEERYPQGFPFEEYAPFNGVMQQYLFFYSRETAR